MILKNANKMNKEDLLFERCYSRIIVRLLLEAISMLFSMLSWMGLGANLK